MSRPPTSKDGPADGAPVSAQCIPVSVEEQLTILERDLPLSQSLIWRRQREFYVQRGLKAWSEDLVPNFITNNPFIAEIYARIVLGFLCDCMEHRGEGPGPFSLQNPLRIVELGAGTGKFSYLFLRQLTALLAEKNIAVQTLRYCMTDCSEGLLRAWRTNRYLAEFAEHGMLEFELLQVDAEATSTILAGKNFEAPHAPNGPLVVIANYVFDSLPQDAFVVKDGEISETLVTTRIKSSTDETLSGLQFSYKQTGLTPGRYSEQSWNTILETYRGRLQTATVLFPSGVLKVLQQLSKLADGRMMVLAADKGFAHEDRVMLCQGPPDIEFHTPNCFSQMVNFDAIGKYFQLVGGEALLPDKHSASLNTCAFLQGRPDHPFSATKVVYRETQEAFGPDDLFTLFSWLNAHMEEMTVPQILAALRLTRWDPVAFLRLFPVLARQARSVVAERFDVRSAVLNTWANHYPVVSGENALAFDCGVILLELRYWDDAMKMFGASQKILGPSAPTSYNLGLCCLGLSRSSEALAYMVEACKLDPQFSSAVLARQRLESEGVCEQIVGP